MLAKQMDATTDKKIYVKNKFNVEEIYLYKKDYNILFGIVFCCFASAHARGLVDFAFGFAVRNANILSPML